MTQNGNNGNGKKPRREYSDNEKAIVLAALSATVSKKYPNGNMTAIATQFSLPRRTLAMWAQGKNQHPIVAELCLDKKADIVELIDEAVREMIGASKGKPVNTALQPLWTSIGIGLDKKQLLAGQPTSITENRNEKAEKAAQAAGKLLQLVKKAG
jgi:hypothetical protein